MLPVAYRVIKGFATFFGVIGVISCIGGIIGGIIANDDLKKNKTLRADTTANGQPRSGTGDSGSRGSDAASATQSTLTTVL